MASLPKSSVPAKALPPLRCIKPSQLPGLQPPSTVIRSDDDVETWKQTQGYADYALFLRRLNESVVGYALPEHTEISTQSDSQAVQSTIALLDHLDHWIDEIPPQPTPQRFGNLAFRAWGKRLEERAEGLLSELLPSSLAGAAPLLLPYLITSFGSFTRLDYGTGHETSFALFLLSLALIRFFEIDGERGPVKSSARSAGPLAPTLNMLAPQPEERAIVLRVFVRYLKLCWRLQDVYRLEPAGSHGVWGLDDYAFLGYIFGSAQLRDQVDVPVSAVLRPPLPATNLYFLQITRIRALKTGPFHEHSSQLHAIAAGVPHWAKANSGLLKMYDAEVLGKRVVVQHLPLGGLLEWHAWTPTHPLTTGTARSGSDTPFRDAAAVPGHMSAPWAQTSAPSLSPVPSAFGETAAPRAAAAAALIPRNARGAGEGFPGPHPGVSAGAPTGAAPRVASALPPLHPRAGPRPPTQ